MQNMGFVFQFTLYYVLPKNSLSLFGELTNFSVLLCKEAAQQDQT